MKLNQNITLKDAVTQLLESFIIDKQFPTGTKHETNNKIESYDNTKQLWDLITNIKCNDFEFKQFSLDSETTLNDLDSKETPVSDGESINIILKNLNTDILMPKSVQLQETVKEAHLPHTTESISTLTSSMYSITELI